MIDVISEDFKDLDLSEYPYDKEHTALGEYHYLKPQGNYGSWYDPIPLHQWRRLGGSWLITSSEGKRYLEQNRGDNTRDAFKNVHCCLVHKTKLYNDFTLSFSIRLFEINHFCGMAFAYKTSRNYYAVGIKNSRFVIMKRYQECFDILASVDIEIDDFKTYNITISIENDIVFAKINDKTIKNIVIKNN